MSTYEKLLVARRAINIVAGFGVSKVVKDIVVNNVTIETKLDLAKVWVGSAVIGSMVADAGSKHINTRFDQVVGWYEEQREEGKENAQEYKSNR